LRVLAGLPSGCVWTLVSLPRTVYGIWTQVALVVIGCLATDSRAWTSPCAGPFQRTAGAAAGL